jgi:hypothetical protein
LPNALLRFLPVVPDLPGPKFRLSRLSTAYFTIEVKIRFLIRNISRKSNPPADHFHLGSADLDFSAFRTLNPLSFAVQALHHVGFNTFSPIRRSAEEFHNFCSLLLDIINIIDASWKSEPLSIVTVSVPELNVYRLVADSSRIWIRSGRTSEATLNMSYLTVIYDVGISPGKRCRAGLPIVAGLISNEDSMSFVQIGKNSPWLNKMSLTEQQNHYSKEYQCDFMISKPRLLIKWI